MKCSRKPVLTKSYHSSALLPCLVTLTYLLVWFMQNAPIIVDPKVQTDDVRPILSAYRHLDPRFGSVGEPSGSHMRSLVPILPDMLYRLLIPRFGLALTAQIVQNICLALLIAPLVILLRDYRFGLVGASLMLFFIFHTPEIMDKFVSGLPRAFAFPMLLLWGTGSLVGNRYVRWIAAFIAAITYPPAFLIISGAECLQLLVGLVRYRRLADLRSLLLFVAFSLTCLSLSIASRPRDTRMYTLEEARMEPAFGLDGRLRVLPAQNPVSRFAYDSLRIFVPTESGRVQVVSGPKLLVPIAVLSVVPLAILGFRRLWFIESTISLAGGAAAAYFLAWIFAFRLYDPYRYPKYGLAIAAILLVISAFSLRNDKEISAAWRKTLGWLAGVYLIAVLLLTGANTVMQGIINREDNAALFDFAYSLPPTTLVLSHPNDGDDLPFWSGCSTVVGFETLAPWSYDDWKHLKGIAIKALDAMYATDRAALIEYCMREGVSHILRSSSRYGPDFLQKAKLFEPFNSYLGKKLASLNAEDLALFRPPSQTVIFDNGEFQLIDAKLLAKAWEGDAQLVDVPAD